METLEKHILKYGIFTTLGLVAFFFLMKLLGLVNIIELRALNAIIMFAGIFMAIKKFKHTKMNLNFNYLSGIGSGFSVGLMTATLFSIFVTIYLYFDQGLMQTIITAQPQMLFIHPITIGMVIFVEAMASGFLFAYVSMQWLKEDKTISLSQASKA